MTLVQMFPTIFATSVLFSFYNPGKQHAVPKINSVMVNNLFLTVLFDVRYATFKMD